MKITDTLTNLFIRHIFAGAPRMLCEACDAMFLLGTIMLRVRVGQKHYTCPKCKAIDTLREATAEEVAGAAPKPNQWTQVVTLLLWTVAALGATFFIYVLIITKGQA